MKLRLQILQKLRKNSKGTQLRYCPHFRSDETISRVAQMLTLVKENCNMNDNVISEIVAQLECIEDLLMDDGRFDAQVEACERVRISIEDRLHQLRREEFYHGNKGNS